MLHALLQMLPKLKYSPQPVTVSGNNISEIQENLGSKTKKSATPRLSFYAIN